MKKTVIAGICMALFCLSGVFAGEADSVVMGFYEDPGYARREPDGTLSGADIEYACRIAQTAGLRMKMKLVRNAAACLPLIDDGSIDMMFCMTEKGNYADRYLFSRRRIRENNDDSYIMFRRDSADLKEKVDEAMDRIIDIDPLYEEKLLRRYVTARRRKMEVFTKEEKQYVSQHSSVVMAVLDNDVPYCYIRSGKIRGILPDYYNEISRLTGLHFVYKMYPSHEKAAEAVKRHEADILGMYNSGIIDAYNTGLRVTSSYATVESAFITRSGADAGDIKRIAVKQRSLNAVANSIDGSLVSKLIVYNNTPDSFEALRKKKVDAIVCGMPSAAWLVNQATSHAYSISALSSVSFDLCGAVSYDDDVLCSIIDKAINSTSYRFDGLVTKNTAQEEGLAASISRIPSVFLASFACILLALVIALIVAFAFLASHHREKVRLEAVSKSTAERNQFLSTISHDMRTPLNAIIGFSDLAEKEQMSDKARGYLQKVQMSGRLLLELINDTLTMSRFNSGKLRLEIRPVLMKDVFDSVIIPVQEAAGKKHIAFSADTGDAENFTVAADSLNLEKILLNLLTNSVKYTPDNGHVSFLAEVSADDDDSRRRFTFTITDDGIGISESFLPHIYEPFLQERRTGYENSGTGLGLAIVKNLVELMDGTISVRSIKDKGTVFTVSVPLACTERVPVHADKAKQGSADLAGKKILLCEDNSMNREIAKTVLEDKGMSVTAVENGLAGVQAFSESSLYEFDAVLMDVRMPVMDGYEAVTAIRVLDRKDAASVPVIAMTADAFEDDVRKCFDAGMNAHIAKPFDPVKLYELLGRMIAGRPVESIKKFE